MKYQKDQHFSVLASTVICRVFESAMQQNFVAHTGEDLAPVKKKRSFSFFIIFICN